MRMRMISIISNALLRNLFKRKVVMWMLALTGCMLLMATWIGWRNFQDQQHIRTSYQQEVRKQWLSNPDKHPHRMAHYGYFAFRPKYPLSFFDFGMESFTGVSVFLEAHKQNTVNFSEASLSTGILRFGEMNVAMLLQLLLPLLIVFIGFDTVSSLRENSTLKIILSQGLSWPELVLGKSMGVFSIALIGFVPLCLVLVIFLVGHAGFFDEGWTGFRCILLFVCYPVYFFAWSLVTVLISSFSKTSRGALVSLIGLWLFWCIVLPRATQALGAARYPTPSKAAFEKALEADLKRDGDRHNPNDPHFKAIKDSLLKRYRVDSVSQLPFNYSGYLMFEGEKISSGIYNYHRRGLMELYENQNRFNRYTAFINPYIAIKNLSMALAGADFASYMDFQDQAEDFRYALAQRMNTLQIKHISNKKQGANDKPYSISRKYWEHLPDFKYEFKGLGFVFENEALSLIALVFWLVLPLGILGMLTHKFKSF